MATKIIAMVDASSGEWLRNVLDSLFVTFAPKTVRGNFIVF